MSLATIINSDIQIIESDLGNKTFTWSGEDYVCSPAGAGELAMLEVGGFSVDISIILKVRKELFTDGIYPAKQQKITYNSKGYRISQVIDDSTRTFLKMFLVDDSRGI